MSVFNMKEDYYRQFLGARKETILRLRYLYSKDYFDDEETVIAKRKEMYQLEFDRIKKYFDLKMGGKVLDIGCGNGGFLSLFGSNWRKYGIDISRFALNEAVKRGVIVDFEFKDGLFDLIIFRGTIQHIPDPISRIEKCYYWLKNKGGLVFLVTPNTNSLCYKLFNDLPLISSSYNFLLPSDIMLKQILTNFGFKIKAIEYPYIGTPYASPLKDIFSFFLKLLKVKKNIKFPFYRNIMEIYAQKP